MTSGLLRLMILQFVEVDHGIIIVVILVVIVTFTDALDILIVISSLELIGSAGTQRSALIL